MKVNEWEELTSWLGDEGIDCYAELIWGAPGETPESFMAGYDRLADRVTRIAVYPMLLLPNTRYSERKADYGIVSVRGDRDDFEYVLATGWVSFAENQRMHRFLFWARVVAEMAVLRHVWHGLRRLAGIRQSAVLKSLDSWFGEADDPSAEPMREAMRSAVFGAGDFGAGVAFLYTDPAAKRLLRRWWTERMTPLLPPEAAPVIEEMFRYDLLTMPLVGDDAAQAEGTVAVRGEVYHVRRGVRLAHDVPAITAALRAGATPDPLPGPVTVDLYYRAHAETAVNSTNHEIIVHYLGMPLAEITENAAADAGDSYR